MLFIFIDVCVYVRYIYVFMCPLCAVRYICIYVRYIFMCPPCAVVHQVGGDQRFA